MCAPLASIAIMYYCYIAIVVNYAPFSYMSFFSYGPKNNQTFTKIPANAQWRGWNRLHGKIIKKQASGVYECL